MELKVRVLFFTMVFDPQNEERNVFEWRLYRFHLRRLTQSDLTKGDRTRVMVCITMDAHGRDVVQKMAREGVTMVRMFVDF